MQCLKNIAAQLRAAKKHKNIIITAKKIKEEKQLQTVKSWKAPILDGLQLY